MNWQDDGETNEFYSTNSPTRGNALLFFNSDLAVHRDFKDTGIKKRLEGLRNLLEFTLDFKFSYHEIRSSRQIKDKLAEGKFPD